ncbi:hypothetical protein [Spiribacter insolitus]|uniref:Flagellin n=1 Tax=Spiribacter insolitus TaxID=3122417 RepID=A0ABV3T8S7_9GAMM
MKQDGIAIISGLVVIAGVGTVAAGTMAAIQNNTVKENEQLRQMQGISIADAARTNMGAGRDRQTVSFEVTNTMYEQDKSQVVDDGSDVEGYYSSGPAKFGYEFWVGTGGNTEDGGSSGSESWGSMPQACGQDGGIICEWGSDTTVKGPIRFDVPGREVVFKVGKNVDVTFEGPVVVKGTLVFRDWNEGKKSLCFRGPVAVTGAFAPMPLKPYGGAGGDTTCGTVSSGKHSTFEKELYVGGELDGNENKISLANNPDSIDLPGDGGYTLADAIDGTVDVGGQSITWAFTNPVVASGSDLDAGDGDGSTGGGDGAGEAEGSSSSSSSSTSSA